MGGDYRFVVHVTPEMIRHSRLLDVLYFVDFVYGVAVLYLLMRTGISFRLRDVASRVARNRFVIAMTYFALLVLVIIAMELPLTFYQGFFVPHQFDLTNQSLASWLGDLGKAIVVNVIIGAPIAALALLAIHL